MKQNMTFADAVKYSKELKQKDPKAYTSIFGDIVKVAEKAKDIISNEVRARATKARAEEQRKIKNAAKVEKKRRVVKRVAERDAKVESAKPQ